MTDLIDDHGAKKIAAPLGAPAFDWRWRERWIITNAANVCCELRDSAYSSGDADTAPPVAFAARWFNQRRVLDPIGNISPAVGFLS